MARSNLVPRECEKGKAPRVGRRFPNSWGACHGGVRNFRLKVYPLRAAEKLDPIHFPFRLNWRRPTKGVRRPEPPPSLALPSPIFFSSSFAKGPSDEKTSPFKASVCLAWRNLIYCSFRYKNLVQRKALSVRMLLYSLIGSIQLILFFSLCQQKEFSGPSLSQVLRCSIQSLASLKKAPLND